MHLICHYKSKFILDLFIFCVSSARFLRWLATIVTFSQSHVCSLVTCCDISPVGIVRWLTTIIDFFSWSQYYTLVTYSISIVTYLLRGF